MEDLTSLFMWVVNYKKDDSPAQISSKITKASSQALIPIPMAVVAVSKA